MWKRLPGQEEERVRPTPQGHFPPGYEQLPQLQGRFGGSEGISHHRPAAATAKAQAEAELGQEEEVRHPGELGDGDGRHRVGTVGAREVDL